MTASTTHDDLREQTERVCIDFLRSDLDLGFTFLRLAETYTRIGARAHATEAIVKAILAHKAVLMHMERLSMGFEQEKQELQEGVGKLLEAIFVAERQFHIL